MADMESKQLKLSLYVLWFEGSENHTLQKTQNLHQKGYLSHFWFKISHYTEETISYDISN